MPPKATMPTHPQSTAAPGQPVPGFAAPPPPARTALIVATCTLEPADPQRHVADLYAWFGIIEGEWPALRAPLSRAGWPRKTSMKKGDSASASRHSPPPP